MSGTFHELLIDEKCCKIKESKWVKKNEFKRRTLL